MRFRRWGIHVCSPWSGDCAMRGIRLNVRTPWWFAIIALNREAKVADLEREYWIKVHR